MPKSKLDFLVTALIIVQLSRVSNALTQSAPVPEECEAVAVWESTREQRIEQEFQRRGISDAAGKQLHRAEVERVIEQRIQTLKELCEQKKK